MTTEEKVKPIIGEWIAKNSCPSDEWTDEEKENIEKSLCYLSMDSYMQGRKDGAAEALRSQWRDASKELPKKGEEVLICFKDNPSEVYACDFDGDVFIGRSGIANNVYLWMSRPPLPNTEEQ